MSRGSFADMPMKFASRRSRDASLDLVVEACRQVIALKRALRAAFLFFFGRAAMMSRPN
jgi:hypothetical protein